MTARRGYIIGNVGSAPDLRETQSGTSVASVRVATEEYYDDETQWVKVVIFGKSAESLAEYAGKGDTIHARGRFGINQWTGNDGETRADIELVADDFSFVSSGGGGSQGGQDGPGPAPQSGGDGADEPFDSSEIPF